MGDMDPRATRQTMPTALALLTTVAVSVLAATGVTRADDTDETAASIVTYRGDGARTGQMIGPAPRGQVHISWEYQATAGLTSSPLVLAGQVLIVSRDGTVRSLSFADGSSDWSVQLGSPASATPLITDDLLIIGDETSVMHALATDDGQEVWLADLGGPASGAAVLDGKVVVTATRNGMAYGLDAATGAMLWHSELGGEVANSVASSGGVAYAGVTPGTIVALATSDGSELWRRRFAPAGVVFTPTVADGQVIVAVGKVDTGKLVTFDDRTGQPRWAYDVPDGVVAMPPAVSAGKAYVVRDDGVVERLDATTGGSEWTVTTPRPIVTVPAVAGEDLIVVGLDGPIQALDTKTGVTRWSIDVRGEAFAPIVTGGLVLLPTDLGRLYAIAGQQPS